jgi:uncharacterized UBP type Zn finger protein
MHQLGKKLVGQAKDIPNLADRCYVLSVIYGLMTRKVSDQNVLLSTKLKMRLINCQLILKKPNICLSWQDTYLMLITDI